MLKLRFDDDLHGVITENDRGEWKIVPADTPFTIIEGFGGEDYIMVSYTPMQSIRSTVQSRPSMRWSMASMLPTPSTV